MIDDKNIRVTRAGRGQLHQRTSISRTTLANGDMDWNKAGTVIVAGEGEVR